MRTLIIVTLCFISACFVCAQDPTRISGFIQTGVANKYIGRPGILFYDGEVWTNEARIKLGSYYSGFWSSTAIAHDPLLGDFGDELQLYVGVEKTFTHVKLDLRATYMLLSKFNQSDDDRFLFDSRADFISVPFITPYVGARYFGSVTEDIPEGGWFVWAGLKRTQPLFSSFVKEKKVSLTGDIHVAYSDGALHREAGIIYGRGSLSLDIPLTQNLTLTGNVLRQIPSGDQTGMPGDYIRKEETVWSVNLKLAF